MRAIYLLIFIILRDNVDCFHFLNGTDYCNHPDCPLKNQHTLCIGRDRSSPRLFASGMTSWMRYQILLLHNRQRDNIAMGIETGLPPAANMRKMYWDYELENMAEVWARQCQKRHDECRNTLRFNVIQNMDVRPILTRVTMAQLLSDAIGAWFSGSRQMPPEYVWSFKLSNCSHPGGCNAHWYSAAAWASTWRIGCSQAVCTAKNPVCSLFRTRRDTDFDEDYNENFTTTENIVRRTKYMTSILQQLRYEDFGSTTSDTTEDSPLHRGVTKKKVKYNKKPKEPKMIVYLFCNYGPAGNIDGFPIYEAGNTCKNCPQGTTCGDRTHRGLCTLVGDPDLTSNASN